jgi:hypothetical protein
MKVLMTLFDLLLQGRTLYLLIIAELRISNCHQPGKIHWHHKRKRNEDKLKLRT